MRTLNKGEVKAVSGGFAVTAGIVIGSFIGGYIYGRLTRAERGEESTQTQESAPLPSRESA